ncbi:MAG: site-specific DNA-methyltransferase [Abitibacteriaceae bacterium]|nr:site-specific DNA-methyltransferase [Abditibacteriaceae bacterium]
MKCKLWQGDCFQLMGKIQDKSVDAVISDPPYGTTDLFWDTKIDLLRFWQEIERVCKDTAVIVLFSQQPFTTDLINSQRKWFRYEIIWHKSLAVGWLSANHRPLRAHENILVFARRFQGSTYNPQKEQGYKPYVSKHTGSVAHYGRQRDWPSVSRSIGGERYPRSVLHFSNGGYTRANPRLHPTQKPLALLEWLVRSYTNPGDVVLDPFMGSGSTDEACLKQQRWFVGIETEPEYFHLAQVCLHSYCSHPQVTATENHV